MASTSRSALDRANPDVAGAIIEKLLPQAPSRRLALQRLAASIRHAHEREAGSWGVTLHKDNVRLNVGPAEACVLEPNGVRLVCIEKDIDDETHALLKKQRMAAPGHYRSVPSALRVTIPARKLAAMLPPLEAAHNALLDVSASLIKRTTWHEAHSPGVIAYLRSALNEEVPDPAYVAELAALAHVAAPAVDFGATLGRALDARGLHFTPWQIATFTTALQVKGFVILSGISGTGKTRLAQHFAALLPQPTHDNAHGAIAVTIAPSMLKYGRLNIPRALARTFASSHVGESREVLVTFDNHAQSCRLVPIGGNGGEHLQLHLRGAARQWLAKMDAGQTLLLEPELDEDQDLVNFRLHPVEASNSHTRNNHNGVSPTRGESGTIDSNALFISVRPDWRDGKSLLGFYNPLSSRYEWTPFLRFLLRAAQSWRAKDGLAWFVILDEMNLARVEHYFADLLSVLESGRDSSGLTIEPLRLSYPPEAEGELPPQSLRLPPNLHFIGTVNTDETTHPFSPKVLDRAFTLEFSEVDFSHYPPAPSAENNLNPAERRALGAAFTREGTFAPYDKDQIATYVESHPDVRARLQTLNTLLRPHNLHFGYRVFDEIIAFLLATEANALFAGMDGTIEFGTEAAFDAALLLKVLPKFHGSRARLEAPMQSLLAWCIGPDAPDVAFISRILAAIDMASEVEERLGTLNYRYPQTAARVRRMLSALLMDGFAAFGE